MTAGDDANGADLLESAATMIGELFKQRVD